MFSPVTANEKNAVLIGDCGFLTSAEVRQIPPPAGYFLGQHQSEVATTARVAPKRRRTAPARPGEPRSENCRQELPAI